MSSLFYGACSLRGWIAQVRRVYGVLPCEVYPRDAQAQASVSQGGKACANIRQSKLAYIDILAIPKIRPDSVKRITKIQNTS